MPTFEINVCVKFDTRRKKKSRKFFPLSQVKFFANVILKCRQFFYLESEIFSFVFSQMLRKRYSQISAIFYLKSEMFSFVSSQLLRKRYSQISAIFFYLKSEMFSFISSRDEGKNFGLKIKNCRCLRITFA